MTSPPRIPAAGRTSSPTNQMWRGLVALLLALGLLGHLLAART